ncbi:Na/Pi cotransporter family protein [Intestinimonas massiliensis]|uniref:Na/Pi cotransporter family protein n=1 Tax=Intestinimonas massiliensis (ex Afouda et al. 2020) TaxID=1673721 RepID=A0ABS9M988_9FIRM|nr:Na/Pi cotransporter family protein [Intestinimonas sp.]MCG4527374.1 Na/Pi cotransporter family protein [Intestinimonas massiliensis (ex Afouda et al. 2020)]MCI5563388.1 Na/Pi cotransporter family protein [Intestinimonas massiliensis (ex Afouda et al. 2020)]MCQ4805227.1 Na/Pi cotransporter family protein [Intestinimonas massiliensis (ex Afouda et al. 2020)]MDY5338101.1 Na/Pi cotransporter family protein [Intestinimonas sp.]
MNATDVITLIGAIATFLFGMSTMTDGLEKLSSGRLEGILERLTSNVFKGVLLGALVTGLIQSSAATTVMCVGFVNAGIMKLPQTVGIIMGANIGTTVTAQLLRLGDISSDNVFLALLKPSILGPLLAAVGIVLFMFLKGSSRRQIVGQILLGLGLLFIGMKTMENAVSGLQELPAFRELFVAFSNPLLGILVGAAVTALIQSSSASMGILQAVSSTGVVSFHIAIPLIMGQNIGTCITALLSAIGASKNAKRTAMVHLLFNIIGTLFFLVVLYAGNALFHFPFWGDVMNRGSIANLHLSFNVACTLLLLPFNRVLVKIVETLVPGDTGTIDINPLDERFLSSPAVALEHARAAVINMGTMARDNYRLAVELLSDYDDKKLERLHETESAIDKLENMLDSYLVKLTDRALTQSESNLVSELLHTLTNFERIGDYSVNLSESATALHSRDIAFSPVASRELRYLTDAVGKAVDTTLACYAGRDHALSMQVEPLEEVVDLMEDTLKNRHIERLKSGACTIELGTQFLELLINLERISDHCSNVAMLILRSTTPAKENLPDNHTYLKYLHSGASAEFEKLFAQYQEQYYAPIRKEA